MELRHGGKGSVLFPFRPLLWLCYTPVKPGLFLACHASFSLYTSNAAFYRRGWIEPWPSKAGRHCSSYWQPVYGASRHTFAENRWLSSRPNNKAACMLGFGDVYSGASGYCGEFSHSHGCRARNFKSYTECC